MQITDMVPIVRAFEKTAMPHTTKITEILKDLVEINMRNYIDNINSGEFKRRDLSKVILMLESILVLRF
jgi:S-adenosylmethionine/arginine decarboxylase-like enzyme